VEKLIITVAPTGSVPRKKNTPHLPTTPDEIAETAYRCEQEGASIIHVHSRDKKENPTSDYQLFEETVSKIRKRTKLVVMVSTSGVAGKSDKERAEPLRTRPDLASLTVGSLTFTARKPSVVYANSWETITYLAQRMRELHIKPELECFDIGFIPQGSRLIQEDLVRAPPLFQLVMGVGGGVPATVANLLHMRAQLPEDAIYTVAGVGRAQLDMTTTSIMLGGHVRVGLEDNIYLAKGELAPNEDFVARANRLAHRMRRDVATSADARQILRL
jgi:3-keto-5-aminohexanoate cleavage enzyme